MKNLTYLVAIALLVGCFLLGRGCRSGPIVVVPKTNFAKMAVRLKDSITNQLTEIASLKNLQPGKDSIRDRWHTRWRTQYIPAECDSVRLVAGSVIVVDSSYISYQRGIITKQDTVIGQYGRLVALKDSSIGQVRDSLKVAKNEVKHEKRRTLKANLRTAGVVAAWLVSHTYFQNQ